MAFRKTRSTSKLGLESLEYREMMNADWGTLVPEPSTVAPAIQQAFVMQDDRFENNDTRTEATQLGTLSSTQTYTNLRMADSADWYRFRLSSPAGNDAAVQLNFLHSQGDIDVQLFNAAGQQISSSNGIGNSERISLAGLGTGEYFVRVFGYNGAHNANYSMTINPNPDDRFENNDTRAEATQLGTLSTTQTYSDLRMSDSADWYRFRLDGTAGSDAAVQLSFLHSQGDIDVQLFNAAGQQISSSNGVGNSERISLAGLGAGEYSVRVFGYNGAQNANYSMTINPSQDDRFENNDTRAEATQLGTLSTTQTYNNLRMADSGDWYRFQLGSPAGNDAAVQLNFLHSQGDIDVQLFNAAGQQISSSNGIGNSERISLAGLGTGEYFVRVFGYNGAHNANYSMTINPNPDDRFENNDTRAEATQLGTLSTTQNYTNLRMSDSADWYRFRLDGTAGSDAAVQLSFLHSQGDIDVQLFNAAGQQISSSNGVGNSERISLAGLGAGEYSVRVFGYNGAQNANYSMTINPSQDDRFENNDTRAEATQLGTLSTSQTYTNLRIADSADWFRFRLGSTAGNDAAVQLNFLHSQGDIDVQLFNAAGQQISSSNGIGNSERISLAGLSTGEYYVRVFGYNGAHNANYSMTINPGSILSPLLADAFFSNFGSENDPFIV